MRLSRIAAFFLALWFVPALPALAQVGHPAKGSWVGYWGPNDKEQRRLVLNLDWQNNQVVGVINPGPKSAKVRRAEIDYSTWALVLEAELPNKAGVATRWVATGTLSNLGSWNNRRYSGTYQFGGETGKFLVVLH